MANKPDYSVGALRKTRDVRQSKVGAAWHNANGTITIKLDPFIVLHGGPERVITLFPVKDAIPTPQTKIDDREIPF